MASQTIRTRFLVLSDTHGALLPENRKPKEPADVVIHCGNLTQESKLKEFRTAIRLLKSIDAPLKLVIAGNHDFTLDTPTFRTKLEEFQPSIDKELIELEYGVLGEARKLLDEAAKEGITFLDEGTHHFTLANGAHLTVYASPYTPSINNWGFQYDPRQGHEWPIKKDVDIVMTHGPLLGILDLQGSRRIGCPQLFEAAAKTKPLMHCFGHVHNDWGARLVRWREKIPNPPSHSTSFEKKDSVTIETLKSLKTARFDTVEMIMEKYKRVKKYKWTAIARQDTLEVPSTLWNAVPRHSLLMRLFKVQKMILFTLPGLLSLIFPIPRVLATIACLKARNRSTTVLQFDAQWRLITTT